MSAASCARTQHLQRDEVVQLVVLDVADENREARSRKLLPTRMRFSGSWKWAWTRWMPWTLLPQDKRMSLQDQVQGTEG